MKNVINAMMFAFKEVVTWNTMKYILLSGFMVTVVWMGIGYLIWDWMVALSSRILELVPFSMVRANGAWMLSTFLWFQAVLLTFALIYAFMGNFIVRKVSPDKYTSFSIWVILGSSLLWAVVWYFKGSEIYHQFLKLLTWLPFETIEKGIAFLIAFYLIYNAIIVTMVFVSSLFSEQIISSVESRHFEGDDVNRDHEFKIIKYTLKDTVLFMLASLVAFPLLFIPVINILVQVVLWIYLLKDTISYDAAALVYENVDKKEIKKHYFALSVISNTAVLFNFVPILNFFGPYFGEIASFHYLKHVEK